MKAILIVDMPNNCDECEYCGFSVEDHDKRSCLFDGCYMLYDFDVESGRHECCPLRPLPQKMAVENRWFSKEHAEGWNACLEEITGETE